MFRWLRIAGPRWRIDARRPASWLAAGAAAWPSIPGVGSGVDAPWLAIAAGAMAAVSAIGDPPRLTRGDAATWVWARAAWPAAAASIAGLVGGLLGDAAHAGQSAAIMVAVIAATAAFVVGAGNRGAAPADAASAALALAAVAAAAAASAPAWPLASAAAAWGGGACLFAQATGRSVAAAAASGVPLIASASRTAVGELFPKVAMLTALAGMAIWLFLAPGSSWCYAFLASAWFIAGAVPQAALSGGERGDVARRRLLATAAARSVGSRTAWSGRLWQERHAWNTVAAYAAILGWPPLVAAVLAGDVPLAVERSGVGATVAVWGLGLAVIASAGVALGCRRETVQAAALLLALAGLTVSAAVSRGRAAPPAGKSPHGMVLSIPGIPARLRELRSLPRNASSKRGVESCKEF